MPELKRAPKDPTVRRLRSQAGGYTRRGNTKAAEQCSRQLKELALAEHIRRAVDEAPPLSQGQRDRLALLLRGSLPDGGRPAA